MVKIIVNEHKVNESNDDLLKVITELKEDNKKLEEIILKLNDELKYSNEQFSSSLNKLTETVTILNNEFKVSERDNDTSVNVNDIKVKKSSIPKEKSSLKVKSHKRKKLTDNDVYVPNNSVCNEWKNISLQKDGKLVTKGHKTYTLPVDLNQLFYIIEEDTPYMNRRMSKKLMNEFEVNISTWGKLIYNIRINNFDDIIVNYNERIRRIKFSLDDNDDILIDNKKTTISKDLAYDWIQIIINSNHKEKDILKIQKSNNNYDKYNIRMICDNYNNKQLLKLLEKPKIKSFIENNPSKRKNLIMNGGI